MVQAHEYSFVARLRARIGVYEKFGSFFLGYCGKHKSYFLDREHSNGNIRCPICFKDWLKNVSSVDQDTLQLKDELNKDWVEEWKKKVGEG